MTECEKHPAGYSSKVKWGAIIAGAAIVTGIVLFAPNLFPSIGDGITNLANNIGTRISGLFNGSTGASSETGEALVNALTGETAKKIYGATLVGGGLAYFLSGKTEEPHYEHRRSELAESFAMKEDMRMMQMKMALQAAAAGNPQAQAFLQQGRA